MVEGNLGKLGGPGDGRQTAQETDHDHVCAPWAAFPRTVLREPRALCALHVLVPEPPPASRDQRRTYSRIPRHGRILQSLAPGGSLLPQPAHVLQLVPHMSRDAWRVHAQSLLFNIVELTNFKSLHKFSTHLDLTPHLVSQGAHWCTVDTSLLPTSSLPLDEIKPDLRALAVVRISNVNSWHPLSLQTLSSRQRFHT